MVRYTRNITFLHWIYQFNLSRVINIHDSIITFLLVLILIEMREKYYLFSPCTARSNLSADKEIGLFFQVLRDRFN